MKVRETSIVIDPSDRHATITIGFHKFEGQDHKCQLEITPLMQTCGVYKSLRGHVSEGIQQLYPKHHYSIMDQLWEMELDADIIRHPINPPLD